MLETGPEDVKAATWGWVFGLSLLGGMVGFYRRVLSDDSFRWFMLAGELATSMLAGILTYLICAALEVNSLLSAAMVGIAGHMGPRAMFILEARYRQQIAPGTSGDSQDKK